MVGDGFLSTTVDESMVVGVVMFGIVVSGIVVVVVGGIAVVVVVVGGGFVVGCVVVVVVNSIATGTTVVIVVVFVVDNAVVVICGLAGGGVRAEGVVVVLGSCFTEVGVSEVWTVDLWGMSGTVVPLEALLTVLLGMKVSFSAAGMGVAVMVVNAVEMGPCPLSSRKCKVESVSLRAEVSVI